MFNRVKMSIFKNIDGEETGEGEYPEDAGSGAGADQGWGGRVRSGISRPLPQPLQGPSAPLPPSLQTRVGLSLRSSLRPWKHWSLLELELRLSE